MKLSKPLSALILIGSVLLLSAESPSLKPSPRPTPKPNDSSTLGDKQSEQQVTPIHTSDFPLAPPNAGAPGKEQEDGSNAPTIIIAVFAVITGLATVAIAKFNKQLVRVTDELRKVAERDVLSDRPFVTVAAVDRDRSYSDFRPCAQFQNSGNSPAVIVEIVFGFNTKPFDLSSREPLIPHIVAPDYSVLSSLPLPKHVLASRETMTIGYGLAYFSDAEWKDILAGEMRIAVFGKIYYRDAAGKEPPYEQPFYWFYSPPGEITPEGIFYLGPDELNR
ncbi:MAG: hypothetical protein ABSD51_09100 [Candidatus Binatus sp.]